MIDTSGVGTQIPLGKLLPKNACSFHQEGCPEGSHLPSKAMEDREDLCRHEWCIIENFHTEFPRDASAPRKYAAYCVYCLQSKGVEIKIN